MPAQWVETTMDVVTRGVGHPLMIPGLAVVVGGLYLVAGIDVANFSISVITLALLPILQHSQNRDGAALQAKLDAVIKAVPDAPDRLIGLDLKTEAEIRRERET